MELFFDSMDNFTFHFKNNYCQKVIFFIQTSVENLLQTYSKLLEVEYVIPPATAAGPSSSPLWCYPVMMLSFIMVLSRVIVLAHVMRLAHATVLAHIVV